MKAWHERPREYRNLFNPAFCGVVLMRAIEAYERESGKAMPFSLSLLILALSFHKETREVLKAGIRSYFVKIIEDNPKILVELPDRIRGLYPYTMEAFAFLYLQGAISVTEEGAISNNKGAIRTTFSGSEESKDCQKVARSIGRKFSQISDRATIYATLGIRP